MFNANGKKINLSTDGEGGSGISNISVLIDLHRVQYKRNITNYKRWPCPFCFIKSKSKIECIIHIKKDHPNIYTADKIFFEDFKNQYNSTLQTNENHDNDNESNSQQSDLKKCVFCPQENQKFFKGDKGLKIHYSKKHKDIDNTLKESNDCISSQQKQKSLKSIDRVGTVECEFCPGRFFIIPNGIKIHRASCKGTICNVDKFADMDEFISSLVKYKMETKVLKRIPNGASVCFSQKLKKLIDECVKDNSITSWQNLFLFTYRILSVPDKRKKNEKISLTSKIKNNVSNNNLHPILSKSKKNHNQSKSKYIESKVFDGDIRGAVRILASDDTQLDYDIAIFEQLKEKHGYEPPVDKTESPDENQPVLEVTAEDALKSISSFKNGSSGGIDSLSPQHLKDLLAPSTGSSEDNLLQSLTDLSNCMLAGKVNVNFSSIIYGVSLIALSKKDGGIRPIAIGCTSRRLTSKLACKAIANDLSNILKPKQLGFSVKGGCEAAVHSARIFLECNDDAELFVKVDVRNAFNSVFRSKMLRIVKEKFPIIYPYIYQCYADHSNLFFGNMTIDSATGCQQGDPLGPPLFCLVINECIQNLTSELNIWYLDDGTLGGHGENVIKDLTTIKQEFSLYGLELNPSKCELYVLPSVREERKNGLLQLIDNILPGIKLLSKNELTLLGAPLTIDAVACVLEKKMQVLSNYLEGLKGLQPHVALCLLQHCLWIPKFTYLLRCCPIFKFENFLNAIDKDIVNALEGLLNLQLIEYSHLQCFLPIKHGGLGIRLLNDIATPAFISSFNSSQALIIEILSTSFVHTYDKDYKDALDKWTLMFPNIDLPENSTVQEEWDLPNINKKLHLISESSLTARARLLALTQKESGGWLQTLPSPYLGSLLDSDTLRIASGIRLGAKICQPYTCICGFPVDEYGTHGLSCITKKGTFLRHFKLNDLLSKGLSTAGFPNILEPKGLVRTDGKRADGLTITPWKNGKSLVWDSTCVDTIASRYLNLTSKRPAAAANKACLKKEELYKDIVIHHYFLPFAVETFGSFSDAAKKFVKVLGSILNSRSGNVRSASFFLQKISLAIQRGNVAGIVGTIPTNTKLDEIFYVH